MKTLPSIKLGKAAKSINVTFPHNIVNRFSHILGVDSKRAQELYDLGARTIDDLIKSSERYNLNRIEKNGCLYFDDLLKEITSQEQEEWSKIIQTYINKIDYHIINSTAESRPSGIHSRMESTVCVVGPCLQIMTRLLDSIQEYIPEGADSVFESFNDEINGICSISRVRTICNMRSPNLVNKPCADKSFILDLTVYMPEYHPLPILRHLKDQMPKGYTLTDTGLFGPDGEKVVCRHLLGRDNPCSIDEIEIVCV